MYKHHVFYSSTAFHPPSFTTILEGAMDHA